MTDTTVATTEDMTAEEGQRLLELEREVEKAMRSAGRICGEALKEIKDRRLYRASHRSFEAYVLDRHGFSRSTAYRMMSVEEPANGLPPGVAAIGQASAQATQRRHMTLDQPPTTITPSPEPLQEDEEEPEEPKPTKPPESRLIPPSPFPRPVQDRGAPAGPEREGKRQHRDHMNRLMQVLDVCDDEGMANCSTRVERIRIARFAIAVAKMDRQPDDEAAHPNTCDHPINRRIGTACGKCGTPKVLR